MRAKKKTEAQIVAEDRKIIEENAAAVDRLAMLAAGSAELVARLKDLSEKLKYLKPVKTQKATETDMKIAAKTDDLKIELSRRNIDTSYRIDGIMSDIMLLLAGRGD